jgi:hypothetical protein
MTFEVIEDTTEVHRRLFKQAQSEVSSLPIAEEHKFGAVNALYIHKLNQQAGLDDLASLAAVYVSGVQHGMAVSRRPWVEPAIGRPDPLDDVIVVYLFDGEPSLDMGYMRADRRWFLSGSEDLEITPILWQPMPALPDNLVDATHH